MAWTNPFTALDRILTELADQRRLIMSNQAKLNAIATQLGVVAGSLNKGLGEVTNELTRLKSAAPEDLDFSAVDRVVDRLSVGVAALDELVPDEIDAEDPTAPEEPAAPAEPEAPVTPEVPEAPVTPETPVESGDGEIAPETPVEAETPASEEVPEATTEADSETDAAAESTTSTRSRSRRAKPADAETPSE